MPTQIGQAAYLAYQNRDKIKKGCIGCIIFLLGIFFFFYLVVMVIISVIQGGGTVADKEMKDLSEFAEFENFNYKTIYGEEWFEFKHRYFFPTLGALTQGVILDSSAKVGLRHIAWDIADRKNRDTEVRAFADGTVVAIKNNILYNTKRRWTLCNKSTNGVCWYQVEETADIQIGCGYEVIIEHADSLRTQYCHLVSEPALKVGDTVTGGQTIGFQGTTGWSTGKHLHFAIWREGQPIDPSYAFSQTNLSDWEE